MNPSPRETEDAVKETSGQESMVPVKFADGTLTCAFVSYRDACVRYQVRSDGRSYNLV